MKILVLGNSSSRWTKEFIEKTLLPLGHEVTVYGTRAENQFKTFYKVNNVEYVEYNEIPAFVMKIPKIRAVEMKKKEFEVLEKHAPYDVIINLFVNNSELATSLKLKSIPTRIYTYFCGSDIIRCEGYKLKRLNKLLAGVDDALFDSITVEKSFSQKITTMQAKKENVVHLGSTVFQFLDERGKIKEESKNELGINNSRTTICIGYNANSAQQHIKALEEIELLDASIKKNLHLLLPMTYGRNEEYIEEVKTKLASMNIEYSIIEDYMDDNQMARLHEATDIFINAQVTDGLSSSVLESMYAGAIVINAKWLDYPEFREWNLDVEWFDDFSNLKTIIPATIKRTENFDAAKNKKILRDKNSWEATRKAWRKILN